MTMLPDVDEQAYGDYEQDRFERAAGSRIAGLGFDHATDARIQSLSSVVTPSDSLTNPLGTGNQLPPEPPPPPPAPAPPAEPPAQPMEAAPAVADQPPPQPAPDFSPAAFQRPPPMQPDLPAPDAPVTVPLRAPATMQQPSAPAINPPQQGATDGLGARWKTQFDFGSTYTGDYRTGTPHRGVDLVPSNGGGIGTEVDAFAPGTVTLIQRDNGAGGLMVYVRDDQGLTHAYMHLAGTTPGLAVGQQVQRGQPLALMGESGTEGSPHLHYEVRKNAAVGDPLNQLIDPRPYLNASSANPLESALTNARVRIGQGKDDFVSSLQPLAQQVAARTGIDPNAMLAIAANETGWGSSKTAQQQNNLFSIQGNGKNGSRWATYDSPQGAFDAFVDLISTAPRYAQAWADRADPGKFVDDLRNAGYVVDEPGYPAQGWVNQVKSIWSGLPTPDPRALSSMAGNVFAPVQNAVQNASTAITDAPAAVQRSFSSMFTPADTDQMAASTSSMALPVSVQAAPEPTPVEKLKGAFSDFLDSIGGTASSAGSTVASAASALLPNTNRLSSPFAETPAVASAAATPEAIDTPSAFAPTETAPAEPAAPQRSIFEQAGDAVGGLAQRAVFGTPEERIARQEAFSQIEQGAPAGTLETDPFRVAAGAATGASTDAGISWQNFQQRMDAINKAIEENNPVRDVPVVGGLTSGLAQQAVNPLNYIFPIGRIARIGEEIVAEVAPTFVAKMTDAALQNGMYAAVTEASKESSSPLSVGEEFLKGAGIGAGIGGGTRAVQRAGQAVAERVGPAIERAQAAFGEPLDDFVHSRQRAEGVNPLSPPPLSGEPKTPPAGDPPVAVSRPVPGPVEQVGVGGVRASTMADEMTGAPKPNSVERALDSGLVNLRQERIITGPSQIFGPEGDVMSTITREEGNPGVTSVVRTGRGAEIGEPSAETRARMPNVDKLAPEMADIRATIQRTAEENPQLIEQYNRGVITHQELIEDLAPRLGMTVEDFLKSPIGKAYNAEELLALRATVVNTASESVRLANAIGKAGGIDNLTPEDQIAFANHTVDAARIQTIGKAGGSEAGRALNQQKIVVTQQMAQSIVGGNESVAAERMLQGATERQSRIDELTEHDRLLQEEKTAAVGEAQKVTSRQPVTRDPDVQKVANQPTSLEQMTEVARLDREMISARRAGDTDRLDALTEQRDGIVANVRTELQQKLQAALDARASAEPTAASMDNVHRAQGRRLLGHLTKEVDAALNPTTQARTAGQLGDAVHKAVLKALKAADAEADTHTKKLTDTLDAISRSYDELAAYRAMSVEEKGADFSGRIAQRAKAAAARAEAVRNRGAPEDLLKALQDELAAERKIFKGKETTRRTLADQQRLRELAGLDPSQPVAVQEKNRNAAASGTKAWLEAQRKLAQQEADKANRELARSHQQRSTVQARQRQQASKLLASMAGTRMNNAMLQAYVDLVNSGDSLAAAKFLRGVSNTSWWQRATLLRYGSMLSSTATQLTNIFSNTIGAVMDVGLKPAVVGLDVVRAGITGGERTRYMSEVGQQIRGEMEGAVAGWKMAAVAVRSGIDPRSVGKAEQSRNAFNFGQTNAGRLIGQRASGVVDIAAEAPSRLLLAADLFFRGAAQGGHVRALATRRGIKNGFSGETLGHYVNEIVGNLTDYPSLLAEAEANASRAVLQESRGGARVATLFGPRESGAAGFAQAVLLPFVRTPYNIAAQGLGLTPLGLLGVAEAGMKGKTGEATERAARALFGTAVMGLAGVLAANDLLTGAMPSDPSARSALPPGWKPWSLKIPDADGNATYVSYQNLGPVGVPLAMGAVMGEAFKQNRPIDPATISAGFGRYMVDQTFLQSMDAIVKTLEQPHRYAENLVEGFVAPTVPYRALQQQIARATGMADRDPHGAIEALQASFLPTMGQVAPRLTQLGEPVQPEQTGISTFVSPVRYDRSKDTEVLRTLRLNDVGVPDMPKELTVAGGAIALTQAEQDQLQAARGARINQYVAGAIAEPSFAKLNNIGRQRVLRRAVSNATSQVDDAFANKLPAEQFQQRVKQKQPVPYVA